MPRAAVVIILASIVALSSALIAQYGFDLHPCVLCIWQRIPFAMVIVFAGWSILARKNTKLAYRLLVLCALTLLANSALSFFHVGVEQHWWSGTPGCVVNPLSVVSGQSPAALRESLLNTTNLGRCDEVAWSLFGVSMTTWNVPFTFGLTIFTVLAAHVLRTGRRLFACKKEAHVKP